MPRNGAGVFNLAQPAFQPSTPISSSAVNSDLSDIADGLTNSLPVDGQRGMTAVLPLASAGFNYTADPDTGIHRTAANEQAIYVGGSDILTVDSTGANVAGRIKQDGYNLLPAGMLLPFAGAAIPNGFLSADGSAVSRTTYADLFASIGTAYGSGDGSTTFNVPDTRGRVLASADGGTNRLPGFTLATAGGLYTAALITANLPAYTPSGSITNGAISATFVIDGNINLLAKAGWNLGTGDSGAGTQFPNTAGTSGNLGAIFAQAASAFGGTPQGGTSTPHANIQPTMAINYIIKT